MKGIEDPPSEDIIPLMCMEEKSPPSLPIGDIELEDEIINFDTYEGILGEMNDKNIRYKSNSSSVYKLMQYCTKIKTCISSEESSKKELWKFLSININNPQATTEEITSLQEKTGLSRSQIRDFFKNQRKRYIIPISDALNNDFFSLADILESPDESLEGYLNKLSGKE